MTESRRWPTEPPGTYLGQCIQESFVAESLADEFTLIAPNCRSLRPCAPIQDTAWSSGSNYRRAEFTLLDVSTVLKVQLRARAAKIVNPKLVYYDLLGCLFDDGPNCPVAQPFAAAFAPAFVTLRSSRLLHLRPSFMRVWAARPTVERRPSEPSGPLHTRSANTQWPSRV